MRVTRYDGVKSMTYLLDQHIKILWNFWCKTYRRTTKNHSVSYGGPMQRHIRKIMERTPILSVIHLLFINPICLIAYVDDRGAAIVVSGSLENHRIPFALRIRRILLPVVMMGGQLISK